MIVQQLRSVGLAACLVIGGLAVGCHGTADETVSITKTVESQGKQNFLHHIIDAQPPGGKDCCTDVLALADINGDGYVDVVVGSEQAKGAGLVWYDYPTWKRHEIGRGEFTTDGKALDFDGDGDVDVVIGDTTAGIVWYEQQGSGRWERHLIAPGYSHDLVVADIDGDGHLDVVRTDKKTLEVWYRAASGFRLQRLLERNGEGLAVADLDGDGDLDILFSNLWLENQSAKAWVMHQIAPDWPADTRIAVVDMNADGRPDVVLTASEGEGGVSWFEAPADPTDRPWISHVIESRALSGAHSLVTADVDLDGTIDIVTAEMHTSPLRRILWYRQTSQGWERQVLASHGSHNMMAADIDRDGDIDIIGKNYGGIGRFVELWENRAADLALVPGRIPRREGSASWQYRALDPTRPDYDRQTFGLIFGDVNSDQGMDVIAGGTLYLRVGSSLGSAGYRRVEVAPGSDIIHMTPRRRFGISALLAVSDDSLQLFEATGADGTTWERAVLKQLPPGRMQGYASGPVRADGSYDFFFTKGNSLFQVRVPGGDANARWLVVRLASGVEEAGVAVADLDGDGDSDIVTVDQSGRYLVWLEATPTGRKRHRLGASLRWIDRVAIADMNNDKRLDIVFTEETRDWEYNARVVWLQAPPDPRALSEWEPHTLITLRSANSLGVADFDGDGDLDLAIAEHTDMHTDTVAADNFTGLLLNEGEGRWSVEVVEIGPHASHLGAQPVDLDGDRIYELISIGWEQTAIHLWHRARALN